jgi:hypothetical protein
METKERLAQTLEGNGASEEMIKNARLGMYDDFISPLPSPIMHLVSDLREEGLYDLAQRAMDGEFDASKEEAEAWFQREGKDAFR